MLIDHFGDTLCFTYPKDRQKSQMFYSTHIKCTDGAKRLSSTDTIKVCVERLHHKCYKFEFHLKGTHNPAEDCNISYETYTTSRPQSWERFFNILFLHRTKSVNIQCKYDTIFQIIHYVVHNWKKHNLFLVGLAELFHDDSRTKLLIEILNKIGLCISYDELQRIDFGVMKRVINVTGPNRVLVSLSMDKKNTHSWRNGSFRLHWSNIIRNCRQSWHNSHAVSKSERKWKFSKSLKIRNHWTKFFPVRNFYYEDCLALPKHFPKMYQSFLNGDFVVRHSSRKCSAVPLDQALEKAYHKPAKSSAGIIGFTRRKEAVCKRNLIKHEKAKYQNFMTSFVKWMRMTSIACTMNYQIGLPKQTNIASQLWWRMYSNIGKFSIWSNQRV